MVRSLFRVLVVPSSPSALELGIESFPVLGS
jgi:hypothetical protein